jgi:hypothetical protein
MTTLLRPRDTGPFGSHFDGSSFHTRESSLSLSPSVNASSITLGTLVVKKTRQDSPVSASSGRVLSNENLPPFQSLVELHNGHRATSLGSIGGRITRVSTPSKGWSYANANRILSTGDSSSHRDTASSIIEVEGEALRVYRQLLRKASRGRTNESTRRTSATTLEAPPGQNIPRQKRHDRRLQSPDHSRQNSVGSGAFRHRDERSLSDVPEQPWATGVLTSPLGARKTEHDPFTHRKRPSTVSSNFVHTVKTASLTNTTISFLSRSLRLTHSSDFDGRRSSDPQYSIDSDRPTTTSSVDEAALHRGLKRRQVMEEIITSEENYVADLKALVFLYSTLLASASSLSSRARASIQRNVIELLHLHEHILEMMHQLSFMSARRKWFDTASPRGLGIGHHLRWRSLHSTASAGPHRSHRHMRSSIETSNPLLVSAKARVMEPDEASKMARLFKKLMPRFDAYEEYCAKHEIIMHELQRRIPAWTEYGMGIESLAKSITSIEQRASEGRKALTVGDLLMKPIQRVCKYPLLLAELLKQTPVVDCPDAHAEIENTLQCFRDAVKEINLAADSPLAQEQIQRRWMLHERLGFHERVLQAHQFRMLGHASHCGVLHVAYQTKFQVDGSYALCILFASHLVLAIPSRSSTKFMILALIHLSDLKLESSTDGKGMLQNCTLIPLYSQLTTLGLQCHTALFTWKLCFEVDGQLFELIMSACSASEEEAWTKALRSENAASVGDSESGKQIPSAIGIDLKAIGVVFGQAGTLTRRLSIQRAATVGNRHSVCQVIIRGTHHAHDLQDLRQSSIAINRSQSHLTTHRTAVLAPKRSERAKMESSLNTVWTRDTLPAPSTHASRGGQIIRASAGSLVRKLSLASIHAPFGRRSASLTLNSKRSGEAFADVDKESPPVPVYQVKKDSQEIEGIVRHEPDLKSEDLKEGELEKDEPIQPSRMPSVVSKRRSLTGPEGILRKGTKSKRGTSRAGVGLGPDDPAKKFYSVSEKVVDVGTQDEVDAVVEEKLRNRKRWSNPMGFLSESIKHMIFSSIHK